MTSTARMRLLEGERGTVQRRAGVPSRNEGGAYTISDRWFPAASRSKQTVPPNESGWGVRKYGIIKCVISPNPSRPSFISTSCSNWPAHNRSLYCRSLSSRCGMVKQQERGPSTIPLMANSMRYVKKLSLVIRLRKRRETCKQMGE